AGGQSARDGDARAAAQRRNQASGSSSPGRFPSAGPGQYGGADAHRSAAGDGRADAAAARHAVTNACPTSDEPAEARWARRDANPRGRPAACSHGRSAAITRRPLTGLYTHAVSPVAPRAAQTAPHSRFSSSEVPVQHYLSVSDLASDAVLQLLDAALALKRYPRDDRPLAGATAALVFQKPSLRTRVSFEVAMLELGGQAVYLSPAEIQ